MKIAVATKNAGKLKEFKELAEGTPYELIQMPETIRDLPPETGETFYENALIKAKFISQKLGVPAIGDDSGLEVDALDCRPGIFSARYSKTGLDYDNCLKLLKGPISVSGSIGAPIFIFDARFESLSKNSS